jgi:hypothetical protein
MGSLEGGIKTILGTNPDEQTTTELLGICCMIAA